MKVGGGLGVTGFSPAAVSPARQVRLQRLVRSFWWTRSTHLVHFLPRGSRQDGARAKEAHEKAECPFTLDVGQAGRHLCE